MTVHKAMREKEVNFEIEPMSNTAEWRKDIRPGDILVMHYGGMWAHVIPGYLNHCAMYVDDGKVIGGR